VKAIGLVARLVVVTLLFTILGFAVGGLIGVVSISIMHAAHLPINVQEALWFGAMPGAVLGMIAGVVIITISERHTRSRLQVR
jgi:hypothetical protein